MPTQRLFDAAPPFPSDVQTMEIPDISYGKLKENDPTESRRLFDACTGAGFIALKLDDSPDGRALLETVEQLFDLDERLLGIPPVELEPYNFQPPKSMFGYKNKGVLNGGEDNIAYYNIGRDEVLGVTPQRANPPLIEQNRALSSTFFRQAHPAMQAIFRNLETHLHLQPGAFDRLNAIDEPSASHLRLLKTDASSAPARLNLLGHTDMGTITLLFNVIGGLQILPPGAGTDEPKDWKYVKPMPGYAVVNIADALVEWSGGVLRSNMHRVVTAPGRQCNIDRYSVGYFVRPTTKALMKRLESKVIPRRGEGEEVLTVEDWEAKRSRAFMNGTSVASIGGRPMIQVEVEGA